MRHRFLWGPLAIALWMMSLMVPCVLTRKIFGSGMEPTVGLGCLLLGFAAIPWYANLAVAVTAITNGFRRFELGAVFAVVAICLALTTFAFNSRELRVTWGFYLWLGSFVAALFSSLSGIRAQRRDRFPDATSIEIVLPPNHS